MLEVGSNPCFGCSLPGVTVAVRGELCAQRAATPQRAFPENVAKDRRTCGVGRQATERRVAA